MASDGRTDLKPDRLCCIVYIQSHRHEQGDIMSASTTVTIRLEPEIKERLDRLATVTHRSKSFLAADAIREYIDLNEWQIRETQAAIAEANAGDFASDADARAVFRKWDVDAA
jgi:predicted transcriptional regulator